MVDRFIHCGSAWSPPRASPFRWRYSCGEVHRRNRRRALSLMSITALPTDLPCPHEGGNAPPEQHVNRPNAHRRRSPIGGNGTFGVVAVACSLPRDDISNYESPSPPPLFSASSCRCYCHSHLPKSSIGPFPPLPACRRNIGRRPGRNVRREESSGNAGSGQRFSRDQPHRRVHAVHVHSIKYASRR